MAIRAALVASLYLAPSSVLDHYAPFVISLLPVFVAGLLDDLGFDVLPKWRLGAAALSSFIAIALLQMWIPTVDAPFLDTLVEVAPVGILLTVFVTTGVCHAFNLIDGLNGLSSGTGALIAVGIAAIAFRAGNPNFVSFSMLFVAALAGFLLYNFPFGRLFLGDAGAYSLGHMLSWFAILLMNRLPDVTTWAVLLLFFWPVADTLFAIFRRSVRGKKFDQPDRLHFHQLVMRALEIMWLGPSRRRYSNPLATTLLMPLVASPIVCGVILWDKPMAGFLCVIAFSLLFVGSYVMILRLAVSCRKRNGGVKPDDGPVGER